MINIIVEFTEREKAEMEAIEAKYDKLFAEWSEAVQKLRPEPEPDTDILFTNITCDDNPEEWGAAIEKENEIMTAWEAAGSPKWRAEREKWWGLNDSLKKEHADFLKRAEIRQFDALGGDLQAILADGKTQAERLIISTYQAYKEKEQSTSWFSAVDVVPLGGSRWKLDAVVTRDKIIRALHLHFDALKYSAELTAELNAAIITALSESPYVAKEGTAGVGDTVYLKPRSRKNGMFGIPALIKTRYPKSYITPTDKISNLAFCGELNGEAQQLAMERRGSKKQITTLVSIDFEKLNGAVQIRGRKELTAYDREVHDAIITLFVDGGNEYITPQMIYQAMTGDPKARLTGKQAEAISDSITKCMYSRVIINADEEAKAYGFEKFKYDGSLISGERVTATLNGNVLECLHLLRKPILYEYADKKNQIGRFDIKLLNSPINKTEEIITLQGYLCRRILSMKGSSTLSKTIVYDTVYNQIGVEASSDGALRKKKNKVRGQIKSILDFWKQEGFILGYCENKRKTEMYSVTIRV